MSFQEKRVGSQAVYVFALGVLMVGIVIYAATIARPDELTNLRLDPFERTGWPNNGTKEGAQQYFDWFKYQFWRFVFVQQVMAKEIQTFLDYPPMQRGASFNLDALKAEMAKRMAAAEAAGIDQDQVIQRILDDDAEIRRHTEPWMEQVRRFLGGRNSRDRVERAYGSSP